MFTKKKVEDQFDKILYTDDIQLKTIFLKKQIDFFKSQKPNFDYDYKSFLILIEEFQTSKIFENNLIWLQLINEIIRLNPTMKKKYFKLAMKIVFSEKNNEIDYDNNDKKDEINTIFNTIINAISVFTDNCEKIFECDSYFQNFNHLKTLLKLLIFDLFPYHYNNHNNNVLLLISNIFFNINKNKESKAFLKNNYFSVMFNLLIEILCYLCLYNSLRIIDMKNKSSFSMIEKNNNYEKDEEEKKISLNQSDDSKKKYLDLIEKSKKLFDLYLNLGEKNNLDLVINYQMLMKIFIIHCLESQYNESNCIDWFTKFYNYFRMNKILKIITDSFDDEIFDLFSINEDIFDEENNKNKKKKITITKKLNFVNNFFYLTESNIKEIKLKNSLNNFMEKFSKLRKKLNENREYVYNGLFILINLLFNEILSKKELTINFKEEFIIITLFKSVMKYMIKTSVKEMLEDNINNIDSLLNLIIGRFGVSLGENIWIEIMVLIKYFYSELSRKDEKYTIKNLSILLKKIILLKINGNYQSNESIFYDLLNKVCESKYNDCIINDYVLFSIYFKNKFKSLKSLEKNLSSLGIYFINLIKENYKLFEKKKSLNFLRRNNSQTKEKNASNSNSEKVIEVFANYILIYLNAYSKYKNKNIELFLYKNLNYLNFYFGIKKNFQSQYINLVINVLNNTSDLDYFKRIINNITLLHVSDIKVPISEELMEKSLNLFKKLIIKLINKLSITYQTKKLNYLFESIYIRLNDNLNNCIDSDFLKNILEIFNSVSITKYNELLIYNKIISKKTANDIIIKNYFSVGKNIDSSILVQDEKNLPKKSEEWCIIDIKEIFVILIKLLKKQNINIELKVKILNFMRDKINDIFFFNKINIEMFLDYVIGLDKDNLKEYILYTDKTDAILSINDILKNIVYLLLYNKRLFSIKNREEIYIKIIIYVVDKINYFKKIIRLIINKYNLKVIKNKNSKHLILMKNLLDIDKEGMPNILNLKLDNSDFNFNNKEREKDINYQIFMDEEIQIDTFVYPKNNLKEILNYFQSYIDILEISLNSLMYIHIKNNINPNNNIPFVKQLEKDVKIRFDKDNKKNNLENNESINDKNETIPVEIKNKYEKICQKFFEIFNKFPSIIQYQKNFLYDIYKLFLYCYDFIIFCGEKYIIKTILILFSISFPEFYQKFYENLNKEFKFKYNNGKDFESQKIESIQLIKNLLSSKEENKSMRINSTQITISSSFLENITEINNYEKSNSETVFPDLNKVDKNESNSKSIFDLQKKKEKELNEKVDRIKSSEECFSIGLNKDNDNEIKDKKEQIKTKNEKILNKILLIRKILIEFIIKSKHSLKIFHVINNIINERNKNKEEGIILFLLLCKWKIINEQNLNRNEDTNIFKNRNKIKNYFNRDIYNISIENLNQKKTVAIKSPISSFNYIINNSYKNIQNKDALKVLTQCLVQEKERKNVEEILYQKFGGENSQIFNQFQRNFNKNNSNSFCYKSSSNVLNEIKELDDEENINLSNSGEKNIKDENGEENNYLNEDFNVPNLEELISIMHKNTKNNLFKMFENELNKVSIKFNNIDKSLLYNELSIIVSYIINGSKKSSIFNLYNSNIIKVLKKLTKNEDGNNIPYNQIKLNEQKEFIYSDNFNITKYILNDIGESSQMSNSYIYLIFNDTLQNKSNKAESLIKNDLDIFNGYIYLYIFIIPVSEEFWKIEFRLNQKKNDDFSKKLKIMMEKNFLKCYFFSIKNNFGYIIYQLKLLFSLLQDLICNIKNGLSDKKLRNKLNGIKHEEMIERIHLFKSIDNS